MAVIKPDRPCMTIFLTSSSLINVFFMCRHILLTDTLSFVPVSITFLHKSLVACLACVQSFTSMHANVILSIANLLECVTTGEAHESLIGSATLRILDE